MTASSADTAELPVLREAPSVVPAPAVPPTRLTTPSFGPPIRLDAPAPTGAPVPAPAAGAPRVARQAVQVERRHARRQRRLWGALGVLVLAATLLLTVAVLDLVH